MANTIRSVANNWAWDSAWGWDYGLCAMAAVRVGLPSSFFFDFLLHNSSMNTYAPNGANMGRGMPYLPGNGALLLAVGMASGGWDTSGNDSSSRRGSETIHRQCDDGKACIVSYGNWSWKAEDFVQFT
uniref:Uncharacterized protein n=1 Tax=Lotharella oceanica TaxID=641309 RepID=A0A7S2TUY7_9EUKA|mmetsp:Transcript_30783/g.57512  ORF Transcript_30783/g.57512 Transcript_30783/m.57512 type:complete len:128 (+) Transcript_30783:41-424(+)